MFDVNIHPVLNGYLVTVGCQQIVFQSPDQLLDELRAYLKNPEEMIDLYREKSINAKYLLNRPVDPRAPEGAYIPNIRAAQSEAVEAPAIRGHR